MWYRINVVAGTAGLEKVLVAWCIALGVGTRNVVWKARAGHALKASMEVSAADAAAAPGGDARDDARDVDLVVLVVECPLVMVALVLCFCSLLSMMCCCCAVLVWCGSV